MEKEKKLTMYIFIGFASLVIALFVYVGYISMQNFIKIDLNRVAHVEQQNQKYLTENQDKTENIKHVNKLIDSIQKKDGNVKINTSDKTEDNSKKQNKDKLLLDGAQTKSMGYLYLITLSSILLLFVLFIFYKILPKLIKDYSKQQNKKIEEKDRMISELTTKLNDYEGRPLSHIEFYKLVNTFNKSKKDIQKIQEMLKMHQENNL